MKVLAEPPAGNGASVLSENDILKGLVELGVQPGSLVLVHASLSAFGMIAGGEQSVIQALRAAVGRFGTVAMPSQSWQLCDPDFLNDPHIEIGERARVRSALPVYDEFLTPTRSMGRIAELFRLQPDAHRSPHPHRSFAAAGIEAREITRVHDPDSPFGESSPLARMYELDARVILLGVGFDKCTSLHLAEERASAGRERETVRNGAPLKLGGLRQWVAWDEPVVDDGDFVAIGEAFDAKGGVDAVTVGKARCRSMSMRSLVDFAAQMMRDRRSA